ncbi:MAG: hypothetical protein PSV35_06470 [bacterium]|nr:hypothetical protein [bacterium]
MYQQHRAHQHQHQSTHQHQHPSAQSQQTAVVVTNYMPIQPQVVYAPPFFGARNILPVAVAYNPVNVPHPLPYPPVVVANQPAIPPVPSAVYNVPNTHAHTHFRAAPQNNHDHGHRATPFNPSARMG